MARKQKLFGKNVEWWHIALAFIAFLYIINWMGIVDVPFFATYQQCDLKEPTDFSVFNQTFSNWIVWDFQTNYAINQTTNYTVHQYWWDQRDFHHIHIIQNISAKNYSLMYTSTFDDIEALTNTSEIIKGKTVFINAITYNDSGVNHSIQESYWDVGNLGIHIVDNGTKFDLKNKYFDIFYLCTALSICDKNETLDQKCYNGSTIHTHTCVDNEWAATNQTCKLPRIGIECTKDSDCLRSVDTDCDEELEVQTGTCSGNLCVYAEVQGCSNTMIFIKKNQLLILLGVIVVIVFFYQYIKPTYLK